MIRSKGASESHNATSNINQSTNVGGISLSPPPLLAHQVKLSSDIGGTLHIEPNDNPKTGEDTLVWFALVRKGGQPLPLEACDCQLLVHLQPNQAGDPPLLTPILTPISTEGFVNIPSAQIVFPTVGQYELVVVGTPSGNESFEPFELSFEVLVTAGKTSSPQEVETSTDPASPLPENLSPENLSVEQPAPQPLGSSEENTPDQPALSASVILGLAIATSTLVGLVYAWVRLRKR